MRLTVCLICLTLAIGASGAPQAGPNLHLPLEEYSPRCRPPPCPPSGNHNVTFPLDCLQYVQCTDGVARTKGCPADTFWHEAAAKCAEPRVANCLECWRS